MDKKLKYYDLMEDLRKQIVSGKIKPGEKLPSENELHQINCSCLAPSCRHGQ